MQSLIYIITLLLTCTLGTEGMAAPSLVLDDGPLPKGSIGLAFDVLLDPEGIWTFEKLKAEDDTVAWVPMHKESQSFGYRSGAVWGRLQIEDRRTVKDSLILEYQYSPADRVSFYQVVNGNLLHSFQAGEHIPHRDWPLEHRQISFPIASADSIVYVRIESSSSLILDFKVKRQTLALREGHREDTIQALYFGALFILIIYNVLIFIVSRLGFYGSYVVYLLGFAVVQASLGGQIHYYLGLAWPKVNDYAVTLGTQISGLGLICFVMGVFELSQNPRRQRLWKLFGKAGALTLVSLILLSPVLPYYLLLMSTFTVVFFISGYAFVSIYLGFQEQERMARWFALAFGIFIVGTLITVFRNIGIFPQGSFANYSLQIGSALEFTLLSFAMADRIKVLQEKVRIEQMNALEAEQAAREANQRALEASEAALAEQTRLAALKDQFLANTSHELRTPLNGMIGMSESLLSSQHLRDEDANMLREILGASKRLSTLVNNILDFSSATEGEMSVSPSPQNLRELLQESLQRQQSLLSGKALEIRNLIEGDSIGIYVDRGRAVQALDCILSNAIKFTEQGSISLRVRQSEGWVELAIQDTGQGMSESHLAKLTEAFAQGDGSAARKQGGTGIGLALAFKLMKALEGSLTVHSSLGVGTTVVMRFISAELSPEAVKTVSAEPAMSLSQPAAMESPSKPAERPLKSIQPAQKASPIASPLSLKPKKQRSLESRILVVDDDDLNRKVVRSHLRDGPFELVEVADGASALDEIQNNGPFDAILLDVMMPGMTGFEVCRTLRQNFAPNELPVLMLTAKQQTSDLAEGFQAGANDYVHKPFAKAELLARLNSQLHMAESARSMQRFVPRDFIRLLGYQELKEVDLGDVVAQHLTILFTDIRGFTSALERMQPEEVFSWLNSCYRLIAPEIRRTGGFVDKYIGDALMALFPSTPDDAVIAAIAMHRGIANIEGVDLGTGIHFGATMLGTLGEPERFEATVLSDAVNIASRLEGVSKIVGSQVILSSEVLRHLQAAERFAFRHLGLFKLKGRELAVDLYELLDADPQHIKKLESRDQFHSGVDAFSKGAFTQAMLHFQTVLDRNSEDVTARFMLERSQKMLGSSGDFDGTIHLKEKS